MGHDALVVVRVAEPAADALGLPDPSVFRPPGAAASGSTTTGLLAARDRAGLTVGSVPLSVVVAVRHTVEDAHSEVVISLAADNSRSWREEVELSGGLVDCSGLT